MSWLSLIAPKWGKYGVLILIALAAFQGYQVLRPEIPALDPQRAEAATRLAEQASIAISDHAGSDWSGRYVKVARLEGDHGDHFRGLLEASLPVRTNCTIVRDSLLSEVRDGASDSMSRLGFVKQPTTDRWRNQAVTNLSQALALAKSAKVDYVVYGKVDDFRVVDGDAQAALELHLMDTAMHEDVLIERFTEGSSAVYYSAAHLNNDAMRYTFWKCLGWALFVILLPMVTAAFWTAVLDNESNVATFLALILLTTIDGTLGWALMDFSFATVWMKVLLGLAISAGFTWNLFVLGQLESARLANGAPPYGRLAV